MYKYFKSLLSIWKKECIGCKKIVVLFFGIWQVSISMDLFKTVVMRPGIRIHGVLLFWDINEMIVVENDLPKMSKKGR